MIKFCPMCGTKFVENAKFCLECGLSIKNYEEKLAKLSATIVNTPTNRNSSDSIAEIEAEVSTDIEMEIPTDNGNFYYETAQNYSQAGNHEEAFKYYLKAAKAENCLAMNKVATMYKNGEGVKKDVSKGEIWEFKWALNRAETNNTYAMYLLYNCYKNGVGTTVDRKKALAWLKKSAELGSETAMEELAKISEIEFCNIALKLYNNHKTGVEDTVDQNRVLAWLKKSAELGNETAKNELAKISEEKSATRTNLKQEDTKNIVSEEKKSTSIFVPVSTNQPNSSSEVSSYLGEDGFSILGYTHFYDPVFVQYNSVHKIFVDNAYKKHKEFIAEYNKNVHNFDEFYSVGLKIFEKKIFETANLSVNIIRNFRRINIPPEEILRICYNERLIRLENFVEPLKKVYANVISVAEQLATYRGLERSSRSRWEGGGFGFSGAIKGAVKAGILNLATDAVRGIGDSITDAGDRRKINQLKAQALNDENFYNGQTMFQYTGNHLEFFCLNFFEAVSPIIELKPALTRADLRASDEILYKITNYRRYDLSELIEAIFSNPFELMLYITIFDSNTDSYRELERLAKYVGLGEKFNDRLAVWYLKEISSFAPKENDSVQSIQVKKDKLKSFRTDLNYEMFTSLKKSIMNQLDSAEKEKREQSQKKKDEGCFITTAVCNSLGKPDDCYELMTFRKFRDTWLVNQLDGNSLIKEYYEIAPKIVANINRLADSAQIYQCIWQNYLKSCLNYIERNKFVECKEVYITMVKQLKKIYAGD